MDPSVASSLYSTTLRQSKCADGREENVAIIKVDKLEPSSASRHAAEVYYMTKMALDDEECPAAIKRMFTFEGAVKPVIHFEVDGGADENPNHIETKFLLAEMVLGGPHLKPEYRRKQASTSTRESNGSAKNVVERVQGSIQEATAGMIFNSDALGDLHDEATGVLSDDKVHGMWKHHAERYRSAVDGAPGLNGASFAAIRGADATSSSCSEADVILRRRPLLIELIKATTSRRRRNEIKEAEPDLHKHVTRVELFRNHAETATHYDTTIRCCDDANCKLGCASAPTASSWYNEGPLLRPFPPVYKDPARPGHYLSPELTLAKYAENGHKPQATRRGAPPERAGCAVLRADDERRPARALPGARTRRRDTAHRRQHDR